MRVESTAIELPAEIVDRVDERLPRTEFDSTDEYIAFVLEEVLSQVEAETGDGDVDTVDEEQVRDRLESLGYLDQ
jgi:Arc/MetJ-type ribon-helix-helix transcriptional regulator